MENEELLARIERLEKLLLERQMERPEKLTLPTQNEGEVRAKRIVLVDENGRTCCILTARADGERGLLVSDQDGEPRLELRADRKDTAVVLTHPDSESSVGISADEESAYFELRNGNGKRSVAMMASASTGGSVWLSDDNEENKIWLNGNKSVVMVHGDGDAAAILSVTDRTIALELIGKDGESIKTFGDCL